MNKNKATKIVWIYNPTCQCKRCLSVSNKQANVTYQSPNPWASVVLPAIEEKRNDHSFSERSVLVEVRTVYSIIGSSNAKEAGW